MNKPQTPNLPLKNHGRTAHHKPNTMISLQKTEHRPIRKRDHTPPRSDPLAVEKTELRSEGLKSTYKEELGGQQYIRIDKAKNREVKQKVNNLDLDRVGTKPLQRFVNASPRLEKKHEFSYYTMDNIPKTQNDKEFKKFLNNQGIDPVSVKLYQNTITHQNNGKGFLVLNTEKTKIDDIRHKLENSGIKISPEAKLKGIYH